MSKVVRLINTNLGKADNFETDAETWAGLKAEDFSSAFITGNVKGVIRETRQTLEAEGALLPTEDLNPDSDYDFSVYFVTKESKAGVDSYEDLGYSELRRECASRDTIEGDRGNYGSSVEMRELLREDDQESLAEEPTGCSSESQLDRIEAKLDTVLEIFEQAEAELQGASQHSSVEEPVEDTGPSSDELDDFDEIASQV